MTKPAFFAALVAVGLAVCSGFAWAHQTVAASSPSSSAARVDGIPIHSTTTGKGPRTVVLVHGWTCDERTWRAQVPTLSKDYRAITVDLPGHGQSGSPKDGKLSIDLFARAIEAVRQEAKVDRVVLVGHSIGTITVMQYARLYPEHTAALVLVDGSISMGADVPRDKVLAAARQYGESTKTREAMVQKMFTPNTTEEVRRQVVAMTLAVPPATPLAAMEAFLDPAIWKDDVFTQPALAIFSAIGQRDDPGIDLPHVKTRFPNVEYHTMPDAGHFLMLEQPAEFNQLLRSFLDKLNF
jgi:pimeloyl-ACP methyl ester carboxylesterase